MTKVMLMINVIIFVISIAMLQIFLMSIFYFKFGWFKFFYHDVMEWHMPIKEVGYNGCSFTSKCKFCGKEIMQDSQGNWF